MSCPLLISEGVAGYDIKEGGSDRAEEDSQGQKVLIIKLHPEDFQCCIRRTLIGFHLEPSISMASVGDTKGRVDKWNSSPDIYAA